jgi:hypothetical protein
MPRRRPPLSSLTCRGLPQSALNPDSGAAQAVPHVYLDADVEVTEALALLGELKSDGGAVTLTDMVLRATGRALAQLPEANAHYAGEGATAPLPSAAVALVTRSGDGVALAALPALDELGLMDVTVSRLAAVPSSRCFCNPRR